MAQNFLYMFEFVVDDLLITRPNTCAPEEYPTCCELTFRSHVYVSICDKEFGGCIETASKSGKCCLFSLESPVQKGDKLQLHVFKKRNDKCKFLIGATEIAVYRIFEKVTNDFYVKNPTWDAHLKDAKADPKTAKSSKRDNGVIDNDCGAAKTVVRKEEVCPTYELHKKLLALSNLNGGMQTGNIVLVMRLACMGPTIVSPFPFNGESTPPLCCPKPKVSCRKEEVQDTVMCKRYFGSNPDKGCPCVECEDENDRACAAMRKPSCKKKEDACNRCPGSSSSPRGCPCEDDEESERGDEDDEGSEKVMKPCTVSPTKPVYGPEKYDEFEANLNGSGLTIRVLNDCHVVEDVFDLDQDDFSENFCANKTRKQGNLSYMCGDICELAKTSSAVRNQIEKRTGGKIANSKSIPVIRGNIKYSGNDSCCCDNVNIPLLNKLPASKTVDTYRKTANDIRNCCLQVNPNDIDNTLKGINATAKKKGIEVCYKSCDDPDTDVFLVRLGKKKPSQNKKSTIEIELRTPKEPAICRVQKCTKETQVEESILDANTGKKGKGKKGKKGKKK